MNYCSQTALTLLYPRPSLLTVARLAKEVADEVVQHSAKVRSQKILSKKPNQTIKYANNPSPNVPSVLRIVRLEDVIVGRGEVAARNERVGRGAERVHAALRRCDILSKFHTLIQQREQRKLINLQSAPLFLTNSRKIFENYEKAKQRRKFSRSGRLL